MSEMLPPLALRRLRRKLGSLRLGAPNRDRQDIQWRLSGPPERILVYHVTWKAELWVYHRWHLIYRMRRVTSSPEFPRQPLLSNRRWPGGCPQLQDLASICMAALGSNRALALGTSFLLRQQLNSGLKIFLRRLHDRRLRWPQSGGSKRFHTRRPGNIRYNKLRICPRATFSQFPLHLFILETKTWANT